jgi:hypothetical protein
MLEGHGGSNGKGLNIEGAEVHRGHRESKATAEGISNFEI